MSKSPEQEQLNAEPDNSFTADVVHLDRKLDQANGAIHAPIHPSIQYGFENTQQLIDTFQGRLKGGSPYARQGTPTTAALEAKLAFIDEGSGAVSFSTGMAAITAVFLTLLRSGDHLIVSKYLFGNTASLLGTLTNFGVRISYVESTDADAVAKAICPETRMIFVETVANPGTQVPDLAKIGQLCQENNLLYVVDNTILSAALFKPKSVKASLVIHSLTKSAAGQGQSLGGVVVDTGLFNWENYPNISDSYRKNDPKGWGLMQIRKKGLRDTGATLSSAQAHQISLGLETLELRLNSLSDTALEVAQFLEQHPKVSKVHYPFLKSHSQHELSRQLFSNGSWLLSFELVNEDSCIEFTDALEMIIKATGLGDTRSLIIPVAYTIFWEMGAEKRKEMNINDSLLRLSIGLEGSKAIISDIEQALNVIS